MDNDYIMASLGVLSKKHRNAAIRLLEKSLDITFAEKKHPSFQASYIADVDRELEEARRKEEEYQKHIEECEAMGYDMSAYKSQEPIGGANGPAKSKAGEAQGQYMGDCTHDCKHCTRRNCPNRTE